MSLEDTFQFASDELERLHEAYVELEGTEIPASIDEAIKKRWEIAVATAELAGYIAYSRKQQEDDSTRAVPLRDLYRIIRALEEQIIKEMVIKPNTFIEKAAFSYVFGWRGIIWTCGSVIVHALKEAALHPKEAARAIWVTAANALLLRFVKSLDVLAIPEMATAFYNGMKMRGASEKKIRAAFLPQRSGPRFRVKRPSRR